MRDKAKALIEEVLRPLIKADGGDIELIKVEGTQIFVRLSGKYRGCPGTSYALSGVVEPLLKRRLGKDVTVIAEGG